MKRLLRITVLFSVTLLWWGEKGYAATPAMDAAEKETVSATVEAEADKKDPKSDKKSDEPKRKRNLGHLSGSFETNTIYYWRTARPVRSFLTTVTVRTTS